MMFSSVGEDLVSQEQAGDRTATGDAMSFASAATGHLDVEPRQGSAAWRKAVSTVMAATSLGAATTPALAVEPTHFIHVEEDTGEAGLSLARALSEIADHYETVLFSYPARVLEIERNLSGDPVSVTVLVSVDGNDTVVRRSIRQFNFDIKPDMRLIVDGVQRGGIKQLAFRVAQPLQLDQEQEDLLESIVSAFKTGTDV